MQVFLFRWTAPAALGDSAPHAVHDGRPAGAGAARRRPAIRRGRGRGPVRAPCAQMSLRLQAAFGLRREASIKIVPAWADRGDTLVLKASWNKGGREIRIPVRTPEQRQLLDEAKVLARGKSLVPPAMPPTAITCRTSATSADGSAYTPSTVTAICTPRPATTK